MLIYNYHPVTGEYISDSTADESPLEPGVYLIPAHATTEAPPPLTPGHRLFWKGEGWMLEPLPAVVKPPEPTPEELLQRIRAQRTRLLYETDWTQLPDAPLSAEKKQEYAVYRQALRDFTSTCDVSNPVWPTPPTR